MKKESIVPSAILKYREVFLRPDCLAYDTAKGGRDRSREKIMLRERLPAAVLVIVAYITLPGSLHAEETFQRLKGQQIRARFVGMELTDQSHWGEVFDPSGTLKSFSMGHRAVGKWRVQKDQLCLDRGSELVGGCYEVWVAGKKVELRNQIADAPLEGVLQRPTDR
jgi:hypothetical protein